MYQSIGSSKPPAIAEAQDNAVALYKSDEYDSKKCETWVDLVESLKTHNNDWAKAIIASSMKTKYFQLVPFFMESVNLVFDVLEIVVQEFYYEDGSLSKPKST